MDERQLQTPYLDALSDYAARNPARLHVPGHKGGQGADPALLEALGERALAMDVPALTHGIDVGVEPTRSNPPSASPHRRGGRNGRGSS